MKKIITILILQLHVGRCISQNGHSSEVDFFKYINYKGITVYSYDTLGYEVNVPSYEFEFSKLKVGYACIFAISKKYPEEWTKKAKESECSGINNYYMSLRCQAKLLFSKDTVFLRNTFDIFVFFIEKKDLEGPFKEQTDEGYYDNYFPKKDCNIIVYKYNKYGEWIEIEKIKNPEGDIPRFVGQKYMQELSFKKIQEYLRNK